MLDPQQSIMVGASPSSEIRIVDAYVSQFHATLRVAPDGVVVQDQGSKNGTWVDGVIVDRAWARLGAVLRFGRVNARVVAGNLPICARDSVDSPVIGQSPAFRSALRTLERAARLRSPILLRGETGTGKEVAARIVHRASERRDEPFVAINCGAIPEPLAESELFGHVRGAFTGAHRDRLGAFGRADGGTLLLDEVAELSPQIQAKLLRVLETGRVLPVGAEQELPVDVRIVAATHRPLEAMVAEGLYREDLYHRLGVVTIGLPPLRDRREDIPPLLMHFAARATEELGYPVSLTPQAVEAAVAHAWPGNVRALRNAVLRAGALADGPVEAHSLVPQPVTYRQPPPPGCLVVPRGSWATMRSNLLRQIIQEEGSIRRAAKLLDVPRTTLGNWLKKT